MLHDKAALKLGKAKHYLLPVVGTQVLVGIDFKPRYHELG
jgi:hypothetical protein